MDMVNKVSILLVDGCNIVTENTHSVCRIGTESGAAGLSMR
jgi:hypothetical protein